MFRVVKIRNAKMQKVRKVERFMDDSMRVVMTSDERTCRGTAAALSMNGCAYVVEVASNKLAVAEFVNGREVAVGSL